MSPFVRIDATNRSNSVSGRGPVGRAGGGPAFIPAGADGPARTNATTPVAPATELNAILALQAVGDFREGKRRALRRGTDLLDLLEAMKADLLVGALSGARLDAMANQLAQLRERVDPDIDAVIDEIELRVLVELAKHGR
jgi:hypothetical protein